MMEEPVVLILPDNSDDSFKNTELKLLKLYKEHTVISEKIIKIQKFISKAISESDGVKLENYSLIEKEYIHTLLKLKSVISSFEKNCVVTSVDLDRQRTLAADQQDFIMINAKDNRNRLKSSLLKISSQIEFFTKKILYKPKYSRQTAPVFVDLSI
jgi:hypothetical protein